MKRYPSDDCTVVEAAATRNLPVRWWRTVSGQRIQFVTNERQLPFFKDRDLCSVDHPWAGYSFEEAIGDGEPLPSHSWSKTTLIFVCGGKSSLRWRHRGIWRLDPVEAGTVSIIRRDVEIQAALPSRPFPMMALQLDHAKLLHLAPAQLLSIDESLVAAQVTQDGHLAHLLSAMRAEVRDGCRSGRLYAESISLALLAYLAARYSTSNRTSSYSGTLSGAQNKTLNDYIQENICENISVSELASLVSMSPSHFYRVFKSTFGEPPYRFVMRLRVELAKKMLAEPDINSTQVATTLGFASQSHFVKVFRQFTGTTPGRYQGGC